jgi:hypothetical protein
VLLFGLYHESQFATTFFVDGIKLFQDFSGYKPDRERVRNGASSSRADEGSPVGEDGQANGVQTCQRRRENLATIEERKSVAEKSSKASNSKTASRSSKCRLTTPPDRSRHPISPIALAKIMRHLIELAQIKLDLHQARSQAHRAARAARPCGQDRWCRLSTGA